MAIQSPPSYAAAQFAIVLKSSKRCSTSPGLRRSSNAKSLAMKSVRLDQRIPRASTQPRPILRVGCGSISIPLPSRMSALPCQVESQRPSLAWSR